MRYKSCINEDLEGRTRRCDHLISLFVLLDGGKDTEHKADHAKHKIIWDLSTMLLQKTCQSMWDNLRNMYAFVII